MSNHKKTFKFSVTIKENKDEIISQYVDFGTRKNPFPEKWSENTQALKALHEYLDKFVNEHFEIKYEELK